MHPADFSATTTCNIDLCTVYTSEHFKKLARALYFVTKICTFLTNLPVPVLPIFDLTFLAAIMCQFASGTAFKAGRVMLFRIKAIPIATFIVVHFSGTPFDCGKFVPIGNRSRSTRFQLQF